MMYSASGRQPASILKTVDEIRINYNDKDILYDYEKDYPDKRIVINISKDQTIDWDYLTAFKNNLNIIVALKDPKEGYNAILRNIPWYWGYEVTDWFELDSLIALGVSEITIGDPLFFNLDIIKSKCKPYNILIRKAPNVAYNNYIPRENGIIGAYIRPEDIGDYEKYIDIIEFTARDLDEERTLLKIYRDDQNWPGNLNFLIKNLNYNIDNRGFSSTFAANRQNCGRRCMINGNCHLCESEFLLVTTIDKNKEWLKDVLSSRN